jgi:hypothetical protein
MAKIKEARMGTITGTASGDLATGDQREVARLKKALRSALWWLRRYDQPRAVEAIRRGLNGQD